MRRGASGSDRLWCVEDHASPVGSEYEIADMDDLVRDYVEENEKQIRKQNQEFGSGEIEVLVGDKGGRG